MQEKLWHEDDSALIYFDDTPGPGGAFHDYRIVLKREPLTGCHDCRLHFQEGGVAEHGVNGIRLEHLLEIVAHRLQCFQAGPYPCAENEQALWHVQEALAALDRRTRERQARGVEGQAVP